MRPVPGFERPGLQWAFAGLGLLLVVMAAAEAAELRLSHATIESLRAAALDARVERDRLERRVAREQSARESFALETARLRGTLAAGAPEPTLTLSPAPLSHPAPPEPSVAPLAPGQVVLLRLVLAGRKPAGTARYEIALRGWSGGGVVWSRSGLGAVAVDGKWAVLARLTGDVLAPGAYELVLKEMAPDGSSVDVGAYEVAVGALPGR